MIYTQPFPVCGFDNVTKSVVEDILRSAMEHDKEFCERHGIPFDGKFLPAGKKPDHRQLLRDVWEKIPKAAKTDFLNKQCMAAVFYLTNSLACFTKSDIEVSAELEAVLEAPLIYGAQAINAYKNSNKAAGNESA